MDAIRLENICFSYRDNPVLKDASISMKMGEYIALTGENGSGKSTALKLIIGELHPQSGNIFLFEKEPSEVLKRERIGYVPQNSISQNQNFPATVQEVMRTGLYACKRHFSPKEGDRRSLEMLKTLGMQDAFSKKIGELSGGQQQRVMLARALVSSPKLLILDEPTAGIDKDSICELYKILNELHQEGLSILMVTHGNLSACQGVEKVFRVKEGRFQEL